MSISDCVSRCSLGAILLAARLASDADFCAVFACLLKSCVTKLRFFRSSKRVPAGASFLVLEVKSKKTFIQRHSRVSSATSANVRGNGPRKPQEGRRTSGQSEANHILHHLAAGHRRDHAHIRHCRGAHRQHRLGAAAFRRALRALCGLQSGAHHR